ncbi:hypothetical protein BJF92_20295 [Rhizobium rhizosphaerae]|uniref:Apple domain-containing protein n=1 Tax=Xaviernesmea rhizosphaerae TaxID=1672749 RepID=A0A1Q9ALQ8_9HYPH|nr:alpha-2-macroglobulin family protein [Xaviernesmea rhizosphaerae]OLP56240.1 hypothetical protein BJF92_20295 [Xaviernesmea rhizosphaerae]
MVCLLMTAALVPARAAEPDRQPVLTENADYFGFDLRTEQNVTLKACGEICAGDKACRAFTYNPKAKWCFLKSDYDTLNDFPGAVAGRMVDKRQKEIDLGAPAALPFLDAATLAEARRLKRAAALPEELKGEGLNALVAAARRQADAGNAAEALRLAAGAVGIQPEDGALWLQAARYALRITDNAELQRQGLLSAINAYELSRTSRTRAAALAGLAESLKATGSPRPALNAYKASLALADSKAVRSAYDALRATDGFRVVEHTIDSDSATPRACVQVSEPLVKAFDYQPYVLLNGQTPQAMEAKDQQICVEGLVHGERYALTLRKGLPSSVDEPLAADVNLDLYIRDRTAQVRFTGENFVLPSTMRRGLPLVSVNTPSASLKLYRIGERNIAGLMANSQFLTQLSGYTADRISEESGALVWQGTVEIASDLNKEVITSIPIDEALPKRQPGVYVMTAASTLGVANEWDSRATQWFVISDIGLSTFTGTDGLTVFARALSTATPMEGVSLQLLARNNEVLATARTDATGRARFDAGLSRGMAGLAPAVITAATDSGDYVFLDMTRAGFDLSDRGVTGRPAPGAIDLFAYTERGIYRTGETVHAAALARNERAEALDGLPLTFVFLRPDGVEDQRMVATAPKLGGYAVDLALQDNAMRGRWTLQIFTDPKGKPLSEQSFLVDDFVPDRITFDMTSAADRLVPGTPAEIDVNGRFLYGAPAAGLALEGEVLVKPVRSDPAHPGYQFGLADEEAGEDLRIPLENLPPLDADGKARFAVTLGDMPSTTRRLEAHLAVRLQESGGRAVERTLTLPISDQRAAIGIKPEFTGDVREGGTAGFQVLALDENGKAAAKAGLSWKLIAVERRYQWYRQGDSWGYEPVISTRQVADGRLDVTPEGGRITAPVGWGRYRLEVEDKVGGTASSVEFDAGFYVAASSTETPDALEIALDKPLYRLGETAKLKISPRFAGKALVTIGSESLVATYEADVPAGGTVVDIPVTQAFGAGAYVTATLFRPGEAQESRMPMRAIGIAWAGVDPEARKLALTLDLPEKTRPRQPLAIPVALSGLAAGEEAYVMVAAVDVGILNLTRYPTPDPDGWYFGQRRLGLELRDLYGKLIDGSLGALGRLRTGGDGGQVALQGNPPTEKLVAFFSGPVRLDDAGRATVSFDIPQFNGTARIMAVAWTRQGVGHAERDVVIRDPLVVTASSPRVLAPGDQSQLRLDLANTDAAATQVRLAITTNDAVKVGTDRLAAPLPIPQNGRISVNLPLSGAAIGEGRITIAAELADGTRLDQLVTLPVRGAAMPVTTHLPVELKPGESLTVDSGLLAESRLDGAAVSLSVARSAALDIPALLMMLDRYPYGCAEQTTSRALPLLYLSELTGRAGLPADPDASARVKGAIERVLSYQSSAGSFGLWSPGSGDLWLDAYVSDFLTRAREKDLAVPDTAMRLALDNLQNALAYDSEIGTRGNEVAYALYVLARNRKASISDLRYYADTKLADFKTPLAKAHLAAALSLYGDQARADSLFLDAQAAATAPDVADLDRGDYGSALRDDAAVLTLAAESRPVAKILPVMAHEVERQAAAKTLTSTQEQMWLLLAARAIDKGDSGIRLTVDGAARQGPFSTRRSGEEILAAPVTIANRGSDPVTATVTTLAAPAFPLPAGGNGFALSRAYYRLDGTEANISDARQNERFVVVLTVQQDNPWPARVILTDLLPGGFEIDNPSLVDSARLANFDWIDAVEPAHAEFRNDRFVAAFDRQQGEAGSYSVAYVVRAVTPGTYEQPAAQVEDMYRPQFSARTAGGRMTVSSAP